MQLIIQWQRSIKDINTTCKSPCNAKADQVVSSMLTGREEEALSYIPTPGFFSSHSTDFMSIQSGQDILKKIIQTFSWFNIAQGLLLPTFYDLESYAIDTLKSKLPLPIHPIGPSIPHMTLDDNPQCNNSSRRDYIKWLDSQPKSSVLYISLGSFMPISGTQMEEMASGIHASGVRFLWIARQEFKPLQELSGEMGLVLPWCDQLRVLCHPSISAFLTHCGWGSTMEGVFAGVPMLTFPLIWDQFPNSKLIVDDWKVGVRVKESQEQVVGRQEIAKVVHDLMNLDALESKELRRRAKELKEKCHRALGNAGSSTTNLDAFVQEILDKKNEAMLEINMTLLTCMTKVLMFGGLPYLDTLLRNADYNQPLLSEQYFSI